MSRINSTYGFLPFRFLRQGKETLLVNDVGEYYFLKNQAFDLFVNHELETRSVEFQDLKAKGFVYDGYLPQTIDLLATKYRTKKRFLYDFTSLHMFVVTRRCNQKCAYCHASSIQEDAGDIHDMNYVTARKCVEIAFRSPSSCIKIEFQGGEPLLNFNVVKEIVEYAEELNESANKKLEFVICTNLVALNEKYLEYMESKDIMVSTSLDGPQHIHDACRKLRLGGGSYDIVTSHLSWAMERLGRDKISALMTVTLHSVGRLPEVIDEYIKQELGSIFIRAMNPFGSAFRNWPRVGCTLDEFLKGYRQAFDYIIQLNVQGTHFPEVFAALLLTRILTPFSTGFVDLQSPTGAGISGVIYDVNGDVYVSDEARMLSRTTGDKTFCIGNVHSDSWNDVFCSHQLRKIISASCIEAMPGCAWCVFQPYCGADPVRNHFAHVTGQLSNGHREFCHMNRSLFNLLFDYLSLKNDEIEDVFWSWITHRTLDEIRDYSTNIGVA